MTKAVESGLFANSGGGSGIRTGGGGSGVASGPGPIGTPTLLTSGSSSNGTAVTASVSPSANSLVFVVISRGDGNLATVTGNGGSYPNLHRPSEGGSGRELQVFTRTAASPSAGAITIATPSNAICWAVFEITNGAIVQSKSASTPSTTPSLTFDSAFTDAVNNLTIGICGSWNDTSTKEAALTNIHNSGFIAGVNQAQADAYKVGQESTVNFTVNFGTTNHGMVIAEIGPAA